MDELRALAIEQRKRLIATIMGTLERELRPMINDALWDHLREVVVGAIDRHHDFMLDVIKVHRDADVSDEILRMLRLIHSKVNS